MLKFSGSSDLSGICISYNRTMPRSEGKNPWLWPLAGVAFAFFWSSASTATKFGLRSAQPLTIAVTRFALASAMMLFMAHIVFRQPLPRGRQWRHLAIYGLLNITIYLGLYVVALQWVPAGIASMAVAANPVLIGLFSIVVFHQSFNWKIVIALPLCTAGVLLAAWPQLAAGSISLKGFSILLACMLSYSSGAVFFAYHKWGGLSLFAINGWQTFLGGLFLSPFAIWFFHREENSFGWPFWASVGWLAIMVSTLAVLLWLWLLRHDALRAGMWLYLCPLFGYTIAAILLREYWGWETIAGIALVIGGLSLAGKRGKQ